MWLVIGLTMILLFNIFNKPQTTNTSSLTTVVHGQHREQGGQSRQYQR